MPELPEVEALVRRLRPEVVGSKIVSVEVLNARSLKPQDANVVLNAQGKRIESIERRGKNIILRLTGSLAMRVHLGMSGNFRVLSETAMVTRSTRVLFHLTRRRVLAFEDRGFVGVVHVYSSAELEERLWHLGPEALGPEFTSSYLERIASRSTRPIKIVLMDQQKIAGLGNIYAAESLFAAGIHPAKAADRIRADKIRLLHKSIRAVLQQAIRDCVTSYVEPGKHEGMHFAVYGRKGEPCVVCGKKVLTIEQDGRTTYFCAACQRK
jgi:formamidopyrimidine-DNA glycosylase